MNFWGNPMSETIPLRDVVQALRDEILAAADAAYTKTVRFDLGQIELEFQVVAKLEKGGEGKLGGKVNFHIFSIDASIGGSGRWGDERTQRVKFVLSPKHVDPATGEETNLQISRRKRGSP
jgi:hypothetical protein